MRFGPLFASALLVLASACSVRSTPDAGGGGGGDGGPCTEGQLLCGPGELVQRCVGGARVDVETCTGDYVCADGLGCVTCRPEYYRCEGADLFLCNADGSGYTPVMTCTADEICSASGRVGQCIGACEDAIANRSNIGCTYWAVDLDNEESRGFVETDAWSQPFAVAIANPSDVTATIRVFQNDAALGAPPVERQVFMGQVMPRDVLEIRLPQREVDGPMDQNPDNRGTWLSPNAYRIDSNYPVVAYQFNPIIQDFSNREFSDQMRLLAPHSHKSDAVAFE